MDNFDDDLFINLVIKDGRFDKLCSELDKGTITVDGFKKSAMDVIKELSAKYNSILWKGEIVH
jgi:hypothetical protein